MAHTLIAINSLKKGLGKLELNPSAIEQDLQDNYVVIAEAIQTVLRREAYPQPYEALKDLTRTNTVINKEEINNFIETLKVSKEVRAELIQITQSNYLGI